MAEAADIPVGERIRFYRQGTRKTQAVVAGLAGISEDYLSQIERGLKTPSTSLLHRLARILLVPTSALLGESGSDIAVPGHPLSAQVHTALMTPGPPIDGDPAEVLAGLRDRVDAAWMLWQTSTSRYTTTGPLLPALIRDVDGLVRSATGRAHTPSDATMRRDAHRLAADLYYLLRTFTKRIGRADLALLVADRALRCAEDADDPLRIAAARWNIGQVLLSTNEAEVAEDVAIHAAEALTPQMETDLDAAALHGALWLVAVVAAARREDPWTARDRLRTHARPVAAQTGEGNVLWTVFGPCNVGLHAVSVEMEAGEAAEALRLADDINVSRCPSIERRATFNLELARCYDQRQEDTGVLLHLLAAEEQAPEDMRYNPLARDLVRGLLRRARPSMADGVRALARRIEMLA